MTEPPGLFDLPDAPQPAGWREPTPPEEEPGRGAKRQAMIASRIATGLHPLCGVFPGLRLHPEAHRERDGEGPRCGDCRRRVLVGHHNRTYPKCGRDERGLSHGDASDCRAWWPACTHFARPEVADGEP